MESPICRTCLAATDKSIFKIYLDQKLSLVEMLKECTGLMVTKSDEISLYICDNCTDEIINSYLFRKKCWDSYSFLMRRLQEMKLASELIKYEVESESEEHLLLDTREESDDFDTEIQLKTDATGEIGIKCELCGNMYSNASLMITHMRDMHDIDDKLNCESGSDSEVLEMTDPLGFESTDEEEESNKPILMKADLPKGSIKCEICEKTYYSRNLLLNHLRNAHSLSEEKYISICALESNSEIRVENHTFPDTKIFDPTDTGPVNCEMCDKNFASRALMLRHMRNKHKVNKHDRLKYECKYCKKLVGSFSNLQRHILLIHEQPKDSPKCICHICGMEIGDPRNFSAHVRRHTGDKPYKCDYCDYRATQRSCVTIHMRKHTGARPYKCDVCNQVFKTSSTLSNHRRSHSDERPFECLVCSKKFKKRALWREHTYIHDPDRHVECTHCGKKFSRKDNLKTHMKKHTGEKQHVCKTCGKAFVQKVCLKNHMKKYHNQ